MMLWGVLLYAQIIYVAVVYIQTKDLISFDFESARLVLPLTLAAIAAGIGSFMVPKLFLKGVRVASYPEALQKSFVPLILKWVLAESMVICGMVLSFENEKNLIVPFFLASLIMFLISFQSQDSIKRMTGLIAS
jgi:F0F1-type ATP synthase membrane subunit c/vacuolar-type H+-ATPase subunit K